MRFVQFRYRKCKSNRINLGVELSRDGDVVDLKKGTNGVGTSLIELLKANQDNGCDDIVETVKKIVATGENVIPRSDIVLTAPITNPDKVICIGMNYRDHCLEQGAPIPTEPVVFNKFPSCIVGPEDPLPFPEVTQELDWEVELAIVIGKKGKNISESDAMNYVLGFTTAHDVSARDWQLKKNAGQWLIGKAMDGFCPLGPAIVTKDEIGDPHNLKVRCDVNGKTMQDSNTNQLVFKTEAILAWVSKFFTLLPGDVILTGTPPGVGVFMKPPQFLKRGDVVVCDIEKIGSTRNKVE